MCNTPNTQGRPQNRLPIGSILCYKIAWKCLTSPPKTVLKQQGTGSKELPPSITTAVTSWGGALLCPHRGPQCQLPCEKCQDYLLWCACVPYYQLSPIRPLDVTVMTRSWQIPAWPHSLWPTSRKAGCWAIFKDLPRPAF